MTRNQAHVLLDARGLFLHSYHSGKDADGSTDSNGRKLHTPGHVLHNFVERHLTPITEHFAPRQIVAVWDAGNQYRTSLCPEYKAHRTKGVSDELREAQNKALEVARKFLDHMGITQVEVPGVEADDVIAYLVAKRPGGTIVHTVDADLIQLASDACSVWLWGEPVDAYRVDDGLNIAPRFMALFKALCGDSSDGYKGIHGFGKKAFAGLLAAYGEDGLAQIDDAFRTGRFDEIDQALAAEPGQHPLLERIKAGLEDARRCYALATLWPSLAERGPHGLNRLNWRKRLPSREALVALLNAHGCGYLMERLERFLPNREILAADGWNEQEDIGEAGALLAQPPFVAVDLEGWASHDAKDPHAVLLTRFGDE